MLIGKHKTLPLILVGSSKAMSCQTGNATSWPGKALFPATDVHSATTHRITLVDSITLAMHNGLLFCQTGEIDILITSQETDPAVFCTLKDRGITSLLAQASCVSPDHGPVEIKREKPT